LVPSKTGCKSSVSSNLGLITTINKISHVYIFSYWLLISSPVLAKLPKLGPSTPFPPQFGLLKFFHITLFFFFVSLKDFFMSSPPASHSLPSLEGGVLPPLTWWSWRQRRVTMHGLNKL
jgi:hypothetical protein